MSNPFCSSGVVSLPRASNSSFPGVRFFTGSAGTTSDGTGSAMLPLGPAGVVPGAAGPCRESPRSLARFFSRAAIASLSAGVSVGSLLISSSSPFREAFFGSASSVLYSISRYWQLAQHRHLPFLSPFARWHPAVLLPLPAALDQVGDGIEDGLRDVGRDLAEDHHGAGDAQRQTA